MFNFILQLLILSSINSLSAGETLTKFHVNETNLQQPRDYPCPDAADIAPCFCDYDSDSGSLTMDCTDISSDEELAYILAKEFPVNDFYQLRIYSTSFLTALDFTCGGVKFRHFYLPYGPFPLAEVSDEFYESCSNKELEYAHFDNTQLSSLVFPPSPLSDQITHFVMSDSNLASVPPISSDSLILLDLKNGQITQLTPGTFDDIPNLKHIYLEYNNIKTLVNGSIPMTSYGSFYYFNNNGLETIEPGTFFLKGETPLNSLHIFLSENHLKTIDASVFELLMPYIFTLTIDGNPLDCGCDLAWIITNPENLEKVTNYFTYPRCADGTLLTDLDPTRYEQFC